MDKPIAVEGEIKVIPKTDPVHDQRAQEQLAALRALIDGPKT
jgi:hypothetical protein